MGGPGSGGGGARKGAGRNPNPEKKIKYATKLRPHLIAWLKKQANAAQEIETALENHIRARPKSR